VPEGLSGFFPSCISWSNKRYYLSLQTLPYLLKQLPPGHRTHLTVWKTPMSRW